ncbi:hypothetical protein KHP62_14240 [Rhodobacteraceae bacterium NNCM2]|nr:hypothetical protein [Coraliihabitans acroporae]
MPFKPSLRQITAGLAVSLGLAPLVVPAIAMAQDDPKDIIAAQIRDQGYACEAPQSAKRDEESSSPDEPVWILECEGGTYRVRLVPDQAAKVERIG